MKSKHYICFHCHVEKTKEDFGFSTRYGRQSWCFECHHLYRKGYRTKDRRFVRYGITPEMFQNMVNEQNNECLICRLDMVKPNVDHNHETGKVRGLLCDKCNRALGIFKDDLEILKSAVKYLEKDDD